MQKQFLCIECVLGQGLCSVLCQLDFTSDQFILISLGTFLVLTCPQNPSTPTTISGHVVTLHLILSTY